MDEWEQVYAACWDGVVYFFFSVSTLFNKISNFKGLS
jgi:hypothetical protein